MSPRALIYNLNKLPPDPLPERRAVTTATATRRPELVAHKDFFSRLFAEEPHSDPPEKSSVTAKPVLLKNPVRYKCPLCSHVRTTRDAVQGHIWRDHEHTNPFCCPDCQYKTFNGDCFIRHDCTKTWTCDHCMRILSTKQSLTNHVATHAPPQFPCDKCGKYFKQKQGLKRHKLRFHWVKCNLR